MTNLYYKKESYEIIRACLEVHKELGCGYLEEVYKEALIKEFIQLGIPFEREKKIEVIYKGEKLNKLYKADFLCYNNIILEIKAIERLAPIHEAQVINYLKGTNLTLGLLVNFGEQSLINKRLIRHKRIS